MTVCIPAPPNCGALTAPTSMALTCRWRSRPQHQLRTLVGAAGTAALCQDRIVGSLSAPPLPHHRTYGLYSAVREVALTRVDQRWETERFEVGVGESYREGFAPGEIPSRPRPRPAALRSSPKTPQLDRPLLRPSVRWCFPLAPESAPQSQADPARESNQHLGCFAEAEIAAPAPRSRSPRFRSLPR